MNNVVTTLAHLLLIESSSYLQVTRTSIKSPMGSKFCQIRPWTAELIVLEHLEKSPYTFFQGGNSFVDHLCYLCIVFVMLSRFIKAALWSPAGKGLTPWLSFVMFYCVFITFPCGILAQVWYLILSIFFYLCHLSYFCNGRNFVTTPVVSS